VMKNSFSALIGIQMIQIWVWMIWVCMIFTAGIHPAPASAVPTQGHKMVAAGPSPFMIEAVRGVAEAGGNVADAAVAAALTLAVTTPYNAALGGGGFAVMKVKEAVEVLDFRETAPAAVDEHYYETKGENASTLGGTSIGVPGVAAGLWALHKKHGKLPWKRLFDIPLKLAQEGFYVPGEWVETTVEEKEFFTIGGQRHFLKAGKSSYRPGERLKQVALAQALIELRNKGANGFYQGAVAEDIVKSVTAAGGSMTAADMRGYKVRWLEPIVTEFNGYKLYLMPPPSSGGVVLRTAFQLADKVGLPKQKPFSVDELHLLGETLNRAFRGRALLGDPDFNKNPLSELISDTYVKTLVGSIRQDRAATLPPLKENFGESTQTTHFSIMDAQGKAVALTVTLNGSYGSKVVSERFGIALNNEMDDFTIKPGAPNQFGLIQGQANNVKPGKRPLSSMSPTLVEKNGRIILALGSPGGPRIISSVFQALYRHLVTGLDVDLAVQSPRVHHQYLPNKLYLDELRFSPETVTGLQKKGHQIEFASIGKVFMVRLNEKGELEGAFDSRGEGAAGGL
jgi:gamma-glutamyltranspeptidase / glutathione hydrolase